MVKGLYDFIIFIYKRAGTETSPYKKISVGDALRGVPLRKTTI